VTSLNQNPNSETGKVKILTEESHQPEPNNKNQNCDNLNESGQKVENQEREKKNDQSQECDGTEVNGVLKCEMLFCGTE
jgi:hypothetical protein